MIDTAVVLHLLAVHVAVHGAATVRAIDVTKIMYKNMIV